MAPVPARAGRPRRRDRAAGGTRLIIDPIDGTRSFVRGIPVFATLLAIEADGAVVAGVASAPARVERTRGFGDFYQHVLVAEGAGCIAPTAEPPARMRRAVRGLSATQLATPYRPDGWTVRQVAHHLPDSHLNAYVRFKLALTEDRPAIKTYDEKRWAELPEARTAPIDLSLDLLDGLHGRWTLLLRAKSEIGRAHV